jgi:hypothetical protein
MSEESMPDSESTDKKLVVWAINEKETPEGRRSIWLKVGKAFKNRDGSITLKLDALPTSGVLQIREEDSGRDRSKIPF